MEREYKIIGAYDTETSDTTDIPAFARSFPILHQIGLLRGFVPVQSIDCCNVENVTDVHMFRYTEDAYRCFKRIIALGLDMNITPVICVHNLSFDFYALAKFLDLFTVVDVCAKSTQKPLTIKCCDEEGNALLVFWDTATFSGKSLETMGNECGYPKLKGCWDYRLIRTPETPLTAAEVAYAKHDIYSLLAWLGYWSRMNDVPENELAKTVLTKTSVVRYKTERICEKLSYRNSKGRKYGVIRSWKAQNDMQRPKSDDELRLMHGCTRGGFTYVSSRMAGCPVDSDAKKVVAYDANSMHIFHAVSHLVPEHFEEVSANALRLCAMSVLETTPRQVLKTYHHPFSVAFHGRFKFSNLRLKGVFKRDGISPLASARLMNGYRIDPEIHESQQSMEAFNRLLRLGYKDEARNPVIRFGKLIACDSCTLLLNELSMWELSRAFEWDEMEPIGNGYMTMRFCKPTDKSVLSFNEMYKRKQIFKGIKHEFEHGGAITCDNPGFIPDYLYQEMREGTAEHKDVNAFYMQLKADLNALYGIEATNEARGDIVLGRDGLEMESSGESLADLREHPKAWYQYGMRIVGWSRIHQMLFMELMEGECECFICGDTDSHKMLVDACATDLESALKPLHDACTCAMEKVTVRVRSRWGADWFDMHGLGHYVFEWETSRFFAAWNKAYCFIENGEPNIVFAGIPTETRFSMPDGSKVDHSIKAAFTAYMREGHTFAETCNVFMGYNVEYDHSLTGLNSCKFPHWGDRVNEIVVDYLGRSCLVDEPCMKTIHPMGKVIGDTATLENHMNMLQATSGNAGLNTDPMKIFWDIDSDKPTILKCV